MLDHERLYVDDNGSFLTKRVISGLIEGIYVKPGGGQGATLDVIVSTKGSIGHVTNLLTRNNNADSQMYLPRLQVSDPAAAETLLTDVVDKIPVDDFIELTVTGAAAEANAVQVWVYFETEG